jgi:hypothetical protein
MKMKMRRNRYSIALAATFLGATLSAVACSGDGDGDAEDLGGETGSGGKSSGGKGSGGKSSGGAEASGGSLNLGGGGASGDTGGPGSGGSEPEEEFECPAGATVPDEEDLSGDLEGDICLTNDRQWYLDGYVFVSEGSVLTIEPGTTIRGYFRPSGEPSVLVVARGGKIYADGTPDAPIVFTSEFDAPERQAGDWGGVVLLGRATNNVGDSRIEGFILPETDKRVNHGGNDDDDSSGSLSYARIEFAGVDLSNGNEINGLTMGSVGRGTKVHHVMVSNALDDGFEWFGGTVSADHLVVNNAGDDMFDADQGFRGKLSYLFGRHKSASSSDPNGFEWDNLSANTDATPRTFVEVEHATLCAAELGVTSRAMVLRRGVSGAISGLVALGFDQAYSLRNASWALGEDAPVAITRSTFFGYLDSQAHLADGAFGFSSGTDPDADEKALAAALSWFDDGEGNSPDAPPFSLESCLSEAGPTGAVRQSGVGAFENGDWLSGAWVSWDVN